jgi:hypothetical protein
MEAAGVEPATRVENAQVIDPGNARIGMFYKIAKSTVRSLYRYFPEFQQLPKPHFQTFPIGLKSILKCGFSISHIPLCRTGRSANSAARRYCGN